MRTMRWISIVAGLTLALLLAGCAVTLPSGDVVAIPIEEYVEEYVGRETEAGAAGSEVAVAEPEPKPEPILFSLLPLSDGEPLRARELFAQASPSVAHVSTPHGTGSAVLVDHGYLVSAAHVVWPYEGVRAVFPDGTEFEELPVAAWDLMLDLALLGPVDMEETEIEPLTFTRRHGPAHRQRGVFRRLSRRVRAVSSAVAGARPSLADASSGRRPACPCSKWTPISAADKAAALC